MKKLIRAVTSRLPLCGLSLLLDLFSPVFFQGVVSSVPAPGRYHPRT